MEFIDKYAKIDGSGADDAMSAGGDEVNYSDVEFIDDETNVQDQGPSDFRLMNVTRDLQEGLQDQSMSADLGECSDPENFTSDHVEQIEYEIDEFDDFKNRIKKFEQDLKIFEKYSNDSFLFSNFLCNLLCVAG